MSWAGTYSHTIILGVDRFAAAVFFNRADVTISSLCWLVRAYPAQTVAQRAALKPWQQWVLKQIGSGLEAISPGHCAAARASDLAIYASATALLA